MEFRTRAVLEVPSCVIVDQANFQLNMREAKAENTLRNLTQQLRQQVAVLYSRSQDCEKSRQEQYLFRTELRNQDSQSSVNQFTQQMKQLQGVTNSLSESGDFKELETASG